MPQALALALFNLGAPLGLATWVATSATAAFIINTTIAFGLSLAANFLLRQPTQAAGLKPQDAQQTVRRTLSPRRKTFGTMRIGGSLIFFETTGGNSDKLYMLLALNHGRIEAFLEYLVDEKLIVINGAGLIQNDEYSQSYLIARYGEPLETEFSEIATDFLIEDMRGDGIASILGIFPDRTDPTQQQELFPNGYPQIKVTITGSVVFDPRDGAQDREDESTWAASANPVVCLLTYLIDPDGYGMAWSRIEDNLAAWKEAADICDEQVLKADATYESRYRLAGTFELTDRPVDVVNRILSCCDGKVWMKGDGSLGISVGRYVAPTVTIANGDILSYEVTRGPDNLARLIGIRASYMSPDHDYTEQEAEPWPNGDTVLEAGEDRSRTVDLNWVPSHGQTRRLMKRAYLRETADWRLTITTNLAGLRAMDERFVTIEIDELGLSESFEVQRFAIDLGRMEVTIEALSVGPEIDDWDEATEEGTAPAPTTGLVPIPRGFGTSFGDFTTNSSKAWDGDVDDAAADCARKGTATSGYIGRSFSEAKTFGKAVVHGSNDAGFFSGENPATTITVYGKQGTAPASETDGTAIGSTSFTDTANEKDGRTILSTDTDTRWDHIWAAPSGGSGAGFLNVAEVFLYSWGH